MTKFFGMMAVALMLLMSWSGIAAADGHDGRTGTCEISVFRLPVGGNVKGLNAGSDRVTVSNVTESECGEHGEWTSNVVRHCVMTSTYIEGRGYVVFVGGEYVDCDQDDIEG